MLDSAHIKGTSPPLCLGRWVDGQDFPVPQVPWAQARSAPCLCLFVFPFLILIQGYVFFKIDFSKGEGKREKH